MFTVPLSSIYTFYVPVFPRDPREGGLGGVGDIYMGSLITDNTSPDTFLPTQGGGAKKSRDTNLESNEAAEKPAADIVCVHV